VVRQLLLLLQQDDGPSGLGQLARGRHTSDAATDDRDVDAARGQAPSSSRHALGYSLSTCWWGLRSVACGTPSAMARASA